MSEEAVERFQDLFAKHLQQVRWEFPMEGNVLPPVGPGRDPFSIGCAVLAIERTCKDLGFSPSRHTLGLYFQDGAVPKPRRSRRGNGQ